MPTYLTMPLPSLRRQSGSQRHCAAVNTKEHTMTISPVALRRKTERKPHPTARYWKKCDVEALFGLPFLDLVYQAAEIHRQNFNPREIQLSTLLSIKTGGCPEDCAYCPQSAHHNTNLGKEQMMDVDEIVEKAKIAKSRGASRFCMGAAWRGPKPKDVETVSAIIKAVKGLGMETCGTFGMLEDGMAEDFKKAGLDYYNHNLDTDPERYNDIIHTRKHEDRMDTLGKVRNAGLKVCCGGIVGMNETRAERAGLIASHAAGRCRRFGLDGVRPYHRRGADYHAAQLRPPVGRAQQYARIHASNVFHGGRELDFLRRQALNHRKPRRRRRPPADGKTGFVSAAV